MNDVAGGIVSHVYVEGQGEYAYVPRTIAFPHSEIYSLYVGDTIHTSRYSVLYMNISQSMGLEFNGFNYVDGKANYRFKCILVTTGNFAAEGEVNPLYCDFKGLVQRTPFDNSFFALSLGY